MTLGEQIQSLRRQRGLSQEALGETLGVSRQAISKWESDLAIPEVEKLIALSRLFSVPVGRLLGVEEETPAAQEALGERERELVEAIVGRYLEELEKKRPKRRRWPYVLAALAALILIWITWGRMDQLNTRLSNVNNNIWRVEDAVAAQMNGLTRQLQEIMEQGASLVADWSYHMAALDMEAGRATLRLQATPKRLAADTEARFSLTLSNGETLEFEAQREGTRFGADCEIPLDDEVRLAVVFESAGETHTQALDGIYGLREATRLQPRMHQKEGGITFERADEWQEDAGWLLRSTGEADVSVSREQVGEGYCNSLQEAAICLLVNGTAAQTLPLEPIDAPTGGLLLEASIAYDFIAPVQAGDRVALVLMTLDAYGQRDYFAQEVFDVAQGVNNTPDLEFYEAIIEHYTP